MTTRLLRLIDTVKAVRQETRAWVHHLTGEGPTTVRRQRDAVAQTLGALPPAPSTRRESGYERLGRPEARRPVAASGRQRVLVAR
jgi:hypothetical protein